MKLKQAAAGKLKSTMLYAKIVSLMVAKFEFSNLTLQHWKIIVHIREWPRERKKTNYSWQLYLVV